MMSMLYKILGQKYKFISGFDEIRNVFAKKITC